MTSFDTARSPAPIAVTMGDPAGIGGDILLSAWVQQNTSKLPAFFAIDDPDRLSALANRLGLTVPIQIVESPAAGAEIFQDALPVLPNSLIVPAEPGALDGRNAPSVISSLTCALDLTLRGETSGILTNPIHKQTLYAAGFEHPGHTEFLAEATGSSPVMMLSCPGLRVVPVTIHVPLSAVPDLLSIDLIVARGRTLARALERDFGLSHPRIAVAALNPHAGESGALGTEEEQIIAPAVETLRNAGIDVTGPHPADTLFHAEARRGYDAVLAMYHDQALIPLKTIDFDNGVNTTLGLPIVRTSPDHGTACDIAGTGKANPSSFIAALRQASTIAAHRALTP
jgi:4-hydroxythreonine-4-phosphate dehydrogenase